MNRANGMSLALVAALALAGCAPFAPPPNITEKAYGKIIIPRLQPDRIPANIPETELYGNWGSGNGYASDGFELRPNHQYSETVMTDTSGPYTWTGHWELHGSRLLLQPVRKADLDWRESLQVYVYKRALTLLPDGPESHIAGEGWALQECFFKFKS